MCSIGKEIEDECNKLSHTSQVAIKKSTELSTDEQKILAKRTGIPLEHISNHEFDICLHHEHVYFLKYSRNQTTCCNPYELPKHHSKPKKEITLQLAEEVESELKLLLVPGKKICKRCQCRITAELKASQHSTEDEQLDYEPTHDDHDIEFETKSEAQLERSDLNLSLGEIGVSPLKLHALSSGSKVKEGKRKLNKVIEKQTEQSESVRKKIAMVLDVNEEHLTTFDMAGEYERLVGLINDKLQVTNDKRTKVQLLTLAPRSLTVTQVAKKFNTSNYLVRKSRAVFDAKGILGMPDKYHGHGLTDEIKTIAREFYLRDEYSRTMPGKKDFVSIKRNVHMQKRLLLCNLSELYAQFKTIYPDIKLCQSSFASLRPKWCVTVDTTGSHSVCVCVYHQNVKLMVDACKFKTDQHTLTDLIVCDRRERNCMIHRCDSCPGTEPLAKHLLEEFRKLDEEQDASEDTDAEEEEEREVRFSQWATTDRSDIVKQVLPVSEFVELLVTKLDALRTHSFIAKTQGEYVRRMKEDLKDGEFLVLGDFAENHTFVVQDEAQSYHWNKKGCTLHPVVIYYRNDQNEVVHESIVFMSDDLKHDYYFVYEVVKNTITHIKNNLNANPKKVSYVTDGCPNQYKNVYHFQTVCYHESDFDVESEWIFFATSHGKSPCDGLGGTAKRLTTRASLQRTIDNQITCAAEMFEFCLSEIDAIKFEFITKERMEELRDEKSFLSKRFDPANLFYLPGTKSMHHFVPLSNNEVGVKVVSTDEEYDSTFNFKTGEWDGLKNCVTLVVRGGEFVVCKYGQQHWIGTILSVDDDEKDCLIQFMHPALPSNSFTWPYPRSDTCNVPYNKLCMVITAPVTSSGRTYVLHSDDVENVNNIFI